MLALALVAEGMGPHAAALSVNASHSAVLSRVSRFQKQGIMAFDNKTLHGRARKLNAAQVEDLRAEIQTRPDIGYRDLYELIAERFGVRYSPAGLRLLLMRDLGYVRRGHRFRAASTEMPPGGESPRRLNRVALRAARAFIKARNARNPVAVSNGVLHDPADPYLEALKHGTPAQK